MKRTEIRDAVLELASDDYVGLWEIAWRLNTLFPNESPSERQDMAGDVTSELLRDGRLTAFRGATFDGDVTPIATDQAVRELETESAWEPPVQGSRHMRVTASSG